MSSTPASRTTPQLLVSVRAADEVDDAMQPGVCVIDVKAPNRGPLGPPDRETIQQVVRRVAQRLPVSVALGELTDDAHVRARQLPGGVDFAKVGLAQCADRPDWVESWRSLIAQLPVRTQLVAVAYADAHRAASPPWPVVLSVAREHGCQMLLIDTFDKSSGNLLTFLNAEQREEVLAYTHELGMRLALAGSLSARSLHELNRPGVALLGVRGAACDNGRLGQVCGQRVRQLSQILRQPTQ